MIQARTAAAAAALALALAATACKKDEAKNDPPGADERRASAAQLTAPPLFAHIPADTPYAFAAFEPIPDSYWKMMGDSIRPELEPLLAEVAAMPDDDADPSMKLLKALVRDLKGNLNEAGMQKLFGINTKSRWAIYGVGIVPVFRLELADPDALTRTVERLAGEAGLPLPTAKVGDRSYYRFADDDALVVAAVADGQLILSGGPAPLVEQALPFIIGTEKPTPSMADGGALKEAAARHGFSGHGVGFIDSVKLLNVVMVADFFKSAAGEGMPEACRPVLSATANRFPRLAFGYDEVNEKVASMRVVLEMEKALLGRLAGLQVEVPGMAGGALAEPALFAVGGGVDLAGAQKLGLDFADGLAALGTACGGDMAEDAAEMKQALGQPLPPPLAKLRGGLVAVLDASLSGGAPSGVEAYAFLASDDPGGLYDLIAAEMPPGQAPQIKRDGSYQDLVPAGMIPGVPAIKGAIKEKALVLAAGSRGMAGADKALAQSSKAPLLFVSYDYGKLMKLGGDALGQLGGSMPGMNERMASMFGMAAMWAHVSDHGLAISMRMEMKP